MTGAVRKLTGTVNFNGKWTFVTFSNCNDDFSKFSNVHTRYDTMTTRSVCSFLSSLNKMKQKKIWELCYVNTVTNEWKKRIGERNATESLFLEYLQNIWFPTWRNVTTLNYFVIFCTHIYVPVWKTITWLKVNCFCCCFFPVIVQYVTDLFIYFNIFIYYINTSFIKQTRSWRVIFPLYFVWMI